MANNTTTTSTTTTDIFNASSGTPLPLLPVTCESSYPTPAAVGFMVIGIVIMAENAVGIWTIYSTPALHSTANIFVCSMAVTDISAGLACLVSNVLIFASRFRHVPENTATHGLMISLVIFAMVILSCAHMAIIALERYAYIAHPFFYKKRISPTFITKTLGVFWIFSFLYISALFVRYFTGNKVSSLCTRQMPDAPGLVVSLSIYVVSMVISCVVYCRIITIATRQKRLHVSHQPSIRLDSVQGRHKPRKSVVQKEKMLQETLKNIKFFVIVFGIFLVFTLPPFLVFVADVFVHVPNTAFRLSVAPAVLNSGVNFVVLTFLNKHFKQALFSNICWKVRNIQRS